MQGITLRLILSTGEKVMALAFAKDGLNQDHKIHRIVRNAGEGQDVLIFLRGSSKQGEHPGRKVQYLLSSAWVK